MKVTYPHSMLWFLVAMFMVPLAYGQGETTLVANFINGNTDFFRSRVYLWNPSGSAGNLTVRVFTMPFSGPSQLLGETQLGSLSAESARTIKVEDLLTDLSIPLPYTDNAGNLTLIFIIGVDNARGSAQVFNNSLTLAFGTYPLQGPGGTVSSSGIPDGSVTSSKIADGAVGSVQLADQVDFGATGSPGFVRMLNSTGTVVTQLGAGTADGGLLNLHGSTGNEVVSLGAATTGDGLLALFDAGGNLFAGLANVVGFGGTVGTSSPSGVQLTQMGPNVFGDGFIETQNTTGNVIVRISSLSGGTGFISVRNSSGTQTAGIDGSTGLVFGNIKSFIVDDPSDSDRMIKYTSVEGPEAAIYVRGTANLVSGQGRIEFPDHFAVMAVPSSITVSLTPRSASSIGLAAVSVSSQGIDVAELGGGANSYSFDYVAYAVRKGFEDYEVYLTQEQVRGLTGQARPLNHDPDLY